MFRTTCYPVDNLLSEPINVQNRPNKLISIKVLIFPSFFFGDVLTPERFYEVFSLHYFIKYFRNKIDILISFYFENINSENGPLLFDSGQP